MKPATNDLYPVLRRRYSTVEQLGRVINRSRTSVWRRLKGEVEFTAGDMFLILDDLIRRGFETEKSPEVYKKYFETEASE